MTAAQLKAVELCSQAHINSTDVEIISHKKGETVLIDLHGFHVEQATAVLSLLMKYYWKLPNPPTLQVVTGAGNHSSSKPVIRQAIQQFLIKKKCKYSPLGAGAFLVNK